MANAIEFLDIYQSFDYSMQAVYSLFKAIDKTLGTQEWGILEEFYKEIFSLVVEEYDPVEIHSIMERLMRIDIEDQIVDYKKILDAIDENFDEVYRIENGKLLMTKEYLERLKIWEQKNPQKAILFLKAFLKVKFQAPIKSELSRQGLLLLSVSQFEFLLVYLLRAYFLYHEKEDESVSEFTLEELDEYISHKLGKEIKFLSTLAKLDSITQKFIMLKGFSRERVTEIIEMRNVFAHRSGRADEKYKKANDRVNIGDRLRISKKYLEEVIEYLHLWGLLLCQLIWRKSGDDQKADKALNDTAIQLIMDKRYRFGAVFCQHALDYINIKSKNGRDILRINYAICLDKLGDEKNKSKILSRINLLPRQINPILKKKPSLKINQEPDLYRIPMSVYALRGEKQRALELVEEGIKAGEITYLDMEYWPIFDYLMGLPRFSEIKNELETQIKIQ